MTRISKLEPYLIGLEDDVQAFASFWREGRNYTDEDEERALKEFAGNVMRACAAILYDITDEDMLAGDDERAEEAIATAYTNFRSKRSDRSSKDSRAEYAADMRRVDA